MKKKNAQTKNRAGPQTCTKTNISEAGERCKTKWICDTEDVVVPIDEALAILDRQDEAFEKELQEFFKQYGMKDEGSDT